MLLPEFHITSADSCCVPITAAGQPAGTITAGVDAAGASGRAHNKPDPEANDLYGSSGSTGVGNLCKSTQAAVDFVLVMWHGGGA